MPSNSDPLDICLQVLTVLTKRPSYDVTTQLPVSRVRAALPLLHVSAKRGFPCLLNEDSHNYLTIVSTFTVALVLFTFQCNAVTSSKHWRETALRNFQLSVGWSGRGTQYAANAVATGSLTRRCKRGMFEWSRFQLYL